MTEQPSQALGLVLPTTKDTFSYLREDGTRRTAPLHRLDSSRKSHDEISASIAHYIMGWKPTNYGDWIDAVSGLPSGYSTTVTSTGKSKWTPATSLEHAIIAVREFNQRRCRMRADHELNYPIPLVYTITPYFVAFSTHMECLFSAYVDPTVRGQIPLRFCQGLLFARSLLRKLAPESPSVTNLDQRAVYFEPELRHLVKLQKEHKDKGDAAISRRDEMRNAALMHLIDVSPLASAVVEFQPYNAHEDELAGPWYKKRDPRAIMDRKRSRDDDDDEDDQPPHPNLRNDESVGAAGAD